MASINWIDSRPPAKGICPFDIEGTRQYGCENEALGRKYSLRVDSWTSGLPWVSDLITPPISLTILCEHSAVTIFQRIILPGCSIFVLSFNWSNSGTWVACRVDDNVDELQIDCAKMLLWEKRNWIRLTDIDKAWSKQNNGKRLEWSDLFLFQPLSVG